MNTFTSVSSLSPKERESLGEKLLSFPLFADWKPWMLESLYEEMFLLEIGVGQRVVAAGDLPSNLFILLDGEAEEQGSKVPMGDEVYDFSWWRRTLHPGDPFGHLALVYQQSQPCTVTVTKKGSGWNVVFITPKGVGDMLERQEHASCRERLLAEKKAARLRGIPALSPVPDTHLVYLAPQVPETVVDAGTVLTEERDDLKDHLLLIDRGRVAISEKPRPSPLDSIKEEPSPEYYLSAGQAFALSQPPFGKPFVPTWAVAETDVKLFTIPFSLLRRLHDVLPTGGGLGGSLEKVDIAAVLAEVRGLELESLSREFLKRLAGYMGLEFTPQWHVLTRQGEVGNKLYILHYGEAIIRATDSQGRERPRSYMMVDAPLHSRYFGLRSLLLKGLRDSSVEATKPSEWFSLAHEDFIRMGQELTGKLKEEFSEWERKLRARKGMAESEAPSSGGEKRRHRCFEALALTPEEIPVSCVNRHPVVIARRFIFFVILLGFFMIFALVYSWSFGKLPPAPYDLFVKISGLTFLVVEPFLGLALWRDYVNDYLAFTDRRVIYVDQKLFLGVFPVRSEYRETPLDRVQDVTVSVQGLMQRLCNYGTLKVESAAPGGNIIFYGAPSPDVLKEQILNLMNRAKRRTYAARKELLRKSIDKQVFPRILPEFPSSVDFRKGSQALRKKRLIDRLPQWLQDPARGTWESFRSRWPFGKERISVARKGVPKHKIKTFLFIPLRWEEGKRVVWRTHWVVLLKKVRLPIVLGVLSLAALWFLGGLAGGSVARYVLMVLAFLVFGVWTWIQYQNWANDMYAVDDFNLYDITKGVLSVSGGEQATPLDRIQNVEVDIKGISAHFLGYGTIVVRSAAKEGSLSYKYITDPYEVRNMIFKRMEEHRRHLEERRAEEDQKRLLAALEVYEEAKRKGPPTPPRVWRRE